MTSTNEPFKCDSCKFNSHYTTGADEYPAHTKISYCSKGYWENGDIPREGDSTIDFWAECPDFKAK
jgi:hypothetical protein